MRRQILASLLVAPALALLAGCGLPLSRGPGDEVAEPSLRYEPVAIAVHKEQRELVLLRNGVPDETYRVRLGSNPMGHKRSLGDRRTPEGVYRICTVKPSRFRSFLWISYPNEGDAAKALEDGRLTRAQFDRIVAALEAGRCPPSDTPLGGLVGIHGDYEDPPRYYDWTEGCIAMARNEELMRLASLVQPGTPVVIYP